MRASLATIEVRIPKPRGRSPVVALAVSIAILALEILGIVHGFQIIVGR